MDKLTHTLHVRVTPDFYKAITQAAEAEKRTETQLARILLEEGLEKRTATRPKHRGAR